MQEALRHAHEVHPEMDFPEPAAREFVRAAAYDDPEHAATESAHSV